MTTPDRVSTAPTASRASRVPRDRLRVAGLFAGVGGIELGLRRANHQITLLCDSDPAAKAVLKEHFPEADLRDDVRDIDQLPRSTQLVAAGFPCQDLSQAGKTNGIGGPQSSLVERVFDFLKRRRVPWVILENVPFMLQLRGGRAIEFVVDHLERLEYRWAYRVLDSRAFGLPQRRRRVFLLASNVADPRDVLLAPDLGPPPNADFAKSVACGFYWTEGNRGLGWTVDAIPTLKGGSGFGIPSPPAIVLPSQDIIKPDIRDSERLQGLPVNWTKPAADVDRPSARWRLVGNAVTVPVAIWLGRRISRPNTYDATADEPLLRNAPWPTAAWNIGQGRHRAKSTAWPVRWQSTPLAEFLQFPGEPLSIRATTGFRNRFLRSNLSRPAGFVDALATHLTRARQNGS